MTAETVSSEKINDVLAYGALGFGAMGVVAPGALRSAYGMTASSGELTYFGRMWGTRMVVIGALALAAEGPEQRRRVAMLAAGMNGVDALVAATTRGLPTRTRVMGALTSGGFAAAAAYGASEG